MKGFKFITTDVVQDVWCPTTQEGTFVAIHPDTGEEFITGNSSPNLAQVPSDGPFRKLFTVPEEYKFVGADLANIEIRVLAHYLAEHGNTDYAEKVLSTDMHWLHSKLAGFWTEDDREWDEHTATPEMVKARKASKGFFFGYLYGQGSSIRGNTLSSGQAIEWYNTTTNERGVCP